MAFGEICGHRALLQLLARAVARDTLPPSLILAGPAGVGKRLVATALAQALNCEQPRRGDGSASAADGVAGLVLDACGGCRACGRIARAVHPDVLLIGADDEGPITVDAVREAVEAMRYRPFEGRRRVLVIDGAERLVPQAQNALLKTLEEPPSSAQFLLVSARPDALLATVRSRCQRISFGRLATRDLADLLVRGHGYSEADARAAAAAAGGSAGRALELASGEVAAAREAALGLLVAAVGARDTRARLDGARQFFDQKAGRGLSARERRQALVDRLHALASLVRDVTLLASGADRAALANPDLQARFEALAKPAAARWGVTAFAAVGEALDAAGRRNAGPKVVTDWIACRL